MTVEADCPLCRKHFVITGAESDDRDVRIPEHNRDVAGHHDNGPRCPISGQSIVAHLPGDPT